MSDSPSGVPALVLQRTAVGEHDLLVDLLTPEAGRLTARARGARRSSRRFGGALEPGTRLRIQLGRGRAGLSLDGADIIAAPRAARADLDRFHQLAYVLEIARLAGREGEADGGLFALTCSYLDHLEGPPATPDALAHWELTVLGHLGFALHLGPCLRTGGPADALSLTLGGAVDSQRARIPDALPIGADGIAALAGLVAGVAGARIPVARRGAVRHALDCLWRGVLGRELRSARFLAAAPG